MKTWKFAIPVLVMLTLSVSIGVAAIHAAAASMWSRAFFAQDETPAKAVPARPPAGQEEPARAAPATPAAEMPDITGTWQLQENKDSFAKIRKSDEDEFDYELHWPVRGNGRPALKLKWHPTSNTFVATAPWPTNGFSEGDAVYVVKAKWKNTRLNVTINLGEKAQKYYEKLREEEKANNTILDTIWFPQMSFVKLEFETDDAGAGEPARAPPAAAVKMPDIAGQWNLHEYQNGYAQIRKLDDDEFDFELHWPGDGKGRPSLKLMWIAKAKEFEGTAPWPLETWARGNAVYRIKPNPGLGGYRRLDVIITPGEEAREHYESIVEKLKADGATPAHLDVLLRPQWQKVVEPVNFRFGETDITAPPPTPKQVESQNLLIVETEDGIAGYSKTLGTWDRVTIEGDERLKHAIVSLNFASVIVGDQLFGFSSESGKWGAMTIPEEHLDVTGPTHSLNMMSIQLGDTTYVFSPQTSKWISPSGENGEAAATEMPDVSPFVASLESEFREEATVAETMPDISGTWQLPEYGNGETKISKSKIKKYSVLLERHWGWGKPVGDPSLELKWIAVRGHFEGRSKWPLHALATGHATYVVTPNDTASVLNVGISLDDAAQHEFDTLAEKLAAEGKSREEIEQQLLHPQWHRTVSPELVQLFDRTPSKPVDRLKNGEDQYRRAYQEYLRRAAAMSTPAMQRLTSELAKLENRAAETAGEIRAIVKKKLAAEPVDEAKLGELRENLKIILTEALDLKLKLEAQQAEHLESRLMRLKGLMDQRKSLRDQIIDRRMHELLDTDATKWDGEVAKTETKATDKKTASDGITIEAPAPSTRAPEAAGQPAVAKAPLIDAHTTAIDDIGSRLVTARNDVKVATLDLDRAEKLHARNALTDKEFEQSRLKYELAVGKLRAIEEEHAALVRDVELQIESGQRQLATAEAAVKFAEISFSVGASDVRPADVAEVRLRRDQIELTLKRLQNRLDYLKKAASDGITIEAPSPPARAPEAAGQPAVGKAPIVDARTTAVDDIGSRLVIARNDVKVAKLELDRNEKLHTRNFIPNEALARSRLTHELAISKFQAIEDELAAQISDVELHIDAAKLAVETARAELESAQENAKKGYFSETQLKKLSRHILQSELEFKRLLNRLEYLKQIGGGPEDDSQTTGPMKGPAYLEMFYATSSGQVIDNPNLIPHLDDRFQVSLFGDKITDADVAKVVEFKELKELSLCDVNVVGPGLSGISPETNITTLYLLGPHATNEWLKNLPTNPKLNNLHLTGSSVTDAGLQHLEKLRWLESLNLSDTSIGDAGMNGLKYVAGLKNLSLKNTLVSDEGLKELSHVPRLRHFSLGSPNVQGYELARLREMGALTDLQFVGEGATDEWMAAVERLQNVTFFELHSTQVTSEGVRAIRDWKMLSRLYLNNNPRLDDRIVEHLKGLNRLQIIELSGTSVTRDGAAKLQEALPKARVLYRAAQSTENPVEEGITPAQKTSRRQLPDAAIQQTVEAFTTARDKLTEAKQELDRYEDLAERNSISTETIVASRKQYVEAEKNLRLTQRWFDHVRSFIAMETFVNKEKFDAAQRTLENAKSKRDQGEITTEDFAAFQSHYEHEEQERKRLEHQADVFRQAIAGKENIVSLSSVMETRDSKAADDLATYRDHFEKYAVGSRFDNPNLLPYLTDRWELSFVGEKFTDADLAQLAAMPRLSTLRLCDVNVSGPGLAELKKVKKLYRLDLFGSRVTDEWLVQLPKMPKLQELRLVGSSITDAGLQQIEKFHWLHKLDLQDTAIGDEGMKALVHVPELQMLWLKNTQVSDEGLKHLSRVPHVAQFSLASPHVQGEGLSHLQTLNRLTHLQLTGSTADDEWMKAIAPLQHVVDFELHGTQVTSTGLAHLRGWTNLRRLYLNVNAQLDDKVIEHLQEIRTLQTVELNGTQLTPEGLVRLRQALPNARIVCDAAEANEK